MKVGIDSERVTKRIDIVHDKFIEDLKGVYILFAKPKVDWP